MKTINSVSGGRTSGYIAMHHKADYNIFSCVCIDDPECAPKDPKVIQYANAKLDSFFPQYGEFIATAEDDATLVALMDLEQLLGTEIIWVRGKSFDDIIDQPSFFGGKSTRLPSWARRYCTLEMKLLPIFEWWLFNLGERCKMNLGFRFDEYERMERFMNSGRQNEFKYPIGCSLKGQKRQLWETFLWRYCCFPLIKNGITNDMIKQYWNTNGWIEGDLFGPRRQIEFPVISNCVGCFHKKPETLMVMANMHPDKMAWFAKQETKGMGTWLDSQTPYSTFLENSENWIPEMIITIGSCDTGGCTD